MIIKEPQDYYLNEQAINLEQPARKPLIYHLKIAPSIDYRSGKQLKSVRHTFLGMGTNFNNKNAKNIPNT